MALFERCEHFEGKCPCATCELNQLPATDPRACQGFCLNQPWEALGGSWPVHKPKYVVNTELMCDKARAYCEGGRNHEHL